MLTDRASYRALEAHYEQIKHLHLRDLFHEDPSRGTSMSAEAAGLYLDYSKNRITQRDHCLLIALAEECGLRDRIDAMFRGDRINVTEKRAVLHTALRAPTGKCSRRWTRFPRRASRSTRCSVRWRSSPTRCAPANGSASPASPSRNIVNIGIGGSDLGPGDGLRSPAPLQRARPHLPLRVQRRRH